MSNFKKALLSVVLALIAIVFVIGMFVLAYMLYKSGEHALALLALFSPLAVAIFGMFAAGIYDMLDKGI